MNLKKNNRIYDSARDLYNYKLPYHNFQHVVETLNNSRKILKQCGNKNISYDEKVVCHAILFHDAEYDVNHLEKGFKNKEMYSAFLASNILSDVGESNEHIEEVKKAIICTHMDAVCCSNNEMIVRAADLLGLAAPYSEFKRKSIELYKERELLSGEKITWEQYIQEVFNIIRNFLKPRIKLNIELFSKSNYMFHTRVFHNLDRLMKSTID